MAKVTLTDLVNLQNETTAVNNINNNNAAITTAMNNTLSRDGTTPNTMGSNLDMNSYKILNLSAPTSNYEPLRLIDAATLNGDGTITVSPLPAGGTVDQVLTKNSSTDFDVSWEDVSSSGGIPVGGTTSQILAKTSNTDYATAWVTNHPIPSGGTAGQALIKNSSTDYDYNWRNTGYVTPEMFGATLANATAGLQAAINSLASTGGVVKLGVGTYVVNGTITIPTNAITIEGSGMGVGLGTVISWAPTGADTACFNITAGASIISNIQLRDFTISTANTTTYKTAIRISDGSVVQIERVWIRSFFGGTQATVTGAVASPGGEIRLTLSTNPSTIYNDGYSVAVSGVVGTTEANSGWPISIVSGTQIDLKGSTFTNAYVSGGSVVSTSQGIQFKGRELFSVRDCLFGADVAMRISTNPNAVGGYALDESNFHNLTLSSTSTSPCLLIDNGVGLTSISFTGVQSWGGGKNGVQWLDRSFAAISEQIRFDNLRVEQVSVAGGWFFDISPNNTLYTLIIENFLGSNRNGLRARNVANLGLYNWQYLNAGTVLDINSTVQMTSVYNCYAIAGSTSTLTSQSTLFATNNQTGGGLPTHAQYASVSGPNIAGSGMVIGTAANATTAVAPFMFIGSCAGIPTGVPSPAFTGRVPMVFDSTNNKIYFYNGSWKGVTVS